MIVVSACDAHWNYIFAVCSFGDGGDHWNFLVCLPAGSPLVNGTDPQVFDFDKAQSFLFNMDSSSYNVFY